MRDMLGRGGEKAIVVATGRHTAASEIPKCLMFSFMDLTFVISAFAFCMHARTSAHLVYKAAHACSHYTGRLVHSKQRNASSLIF